MSASVYQAATDEIDRLRAENHRLAQIVKAADVVHIRLRASVREACETGIKLLNGEMGDITAMHVFVGLAKTVEL